MIQLNEDLFKALSQALRMTYKEISTQSGISMTTLYRIIEAPLKISVQQLIDLSNGLHVPVSRFFSRDNKESIGLMLFGAEKGSYTDSDRDRMGVLIGHCGEVVFLDEIGDMDIETQTHLLTYMDNGQVMPRGMASAVCSPCILIAATNKDVNNDSTFRKDILNRFEHVIEIPPIRERKQDMRLLISILLQNNKLNPFISDVQRKVQRISLDAIKYLEDREYSGNFRELKFRITQAVNSAFIEGNSCLCLRHFLFHEQ